MKLWQPVKAYIRQWFKGIEIVEIFPGLYQSSAIRWPWDKAKVKAMGIGVVIDLSGGFDPALPWVETYVSWQIKDEPNLPNLVTLESVARFAIRMRAAGFGVLTH